jgi:hypothetical protein
LESLSAETEKPGEFLHLSPAARSVAVTESIIAKSRSRTNSVLREQASQKQLEIMIICPLFFPNLPRVPGWLGASLAEKVVLVRPGLNAHQHHIVLDGRDGQVLAETSTCAAIF